MSFKLTINKDYAAKYDKWRQKEEYNKLKDKYGEVEESSSSEESEDDNAEGLTEVKEQEWLRMLAALKQKNPVIYEKNREFYLDDDEQDGNKTPKKNKKQKPLTLKDYERQRLLSKSGDHLTTSEVSDDNADAKTDDHIDSDESDDEDENDESFTPQIPGYYEQLDELKNELKAAMDQTPDDEGENQLLIKRQKTAEEEQREEADYALWLKGEKDSLSKDKHLQRDLGALRDYWSRTDLDDNEKFLRDYFLDKKYLDPHDDDELPTYDEIVNDVCDTSEDEHLIEQQDDFEQKYNFRFQEPDHQFIKQFARKIDGSLRQDDNKRSKKRKLATERKAAEKQKRMEEVKQLKNLKKMEIMEKIEKLKSVTRNERLAFDEKELEGDFDPSRYDDMMAEAFGDEFYEEEIVEEKPVFEHDDEIDDDINWDDVETGGHDSYAEGRNSNYSNYYSNDGEDLNMDADYDPSVAVISKKSKKKMKKSKFFQSLMKNKPKYNPDEKDFDEYVDEYYNLDCEDIIAGEPVKFSYRKVIANDYGLDVSEVLSCPDSELNAWNSLKLMNQYRDDENEQELVKKYRSKGKNWKKKLKVLPSLSEDIIDDEDKKWMKSNNVSTSTASVEHGTSLPIDPMMGDRGHKQKRNHSETVNSCNTFCIRDVRKKKGFEVDHSVQVNPNCKRLKKDCADENRHGKSAHKNTDNLLTADVSSNDFSKSDTSTSKPGRKSRRHRRKILQAHAESSGVNALKIRSKHKKIVKISDQRLKAYGIADTSRFRYSQKHLNIIS